MKKIIFITAVILSLKGLSQSSILITNITSASTVAANEIINVVTTASLTTQIDFDIKNVSSSTKAYNVKRYDVLLHAAATTTANAHFCFNGSCFPDFITSAGPLTLNAGQSASQSTVSYIILTTDLDEAYAVGYSLVKYTFYDVANVNDSLQFSIKYNSAPLGLSEVKNNVLSTFELFPNPATDAVSLKITSQKTMDAKVIIYNALGAIVSEKPTVILEGKNKIDINVSDLNSGIYFTQIKMGSNIVTKRLVVK